MCFGPYADQRAGISVLWAAAAYSQAGLEQGAEVYDKIASKELEKAVDSLKQVCVPDEAHPVKVKWNC